MTDSFAFDWAKLLKFGVTTLDLKPQEFWELTPVELSMMVGDLSEYPALGRVQMSELMSKFPDKNKEEK